MYIKGYFFFVSLDHAGAKYCVIMDEQSPTMRLKTCKCLIPSQNKNTDHPRKWFQFHFFDTK